MTNQQQENKSSSYMRRFRVKYRRRRQCKTNYRKRARLVGQAKNKYGAKKHRLVVRASNRCITAQVFFSDLTHDVCIAAAYSHELRRYGVPVGLTNYAAAYCTGLLLARRLVAKLGREREGAEEVTGDFYLDDESGAFRAYLDTGLARCSTGAVIFGVLKGAADGGLNVPHGTRRFPGASFSKEEAGKGEWDFDPEKHRERIFGVHVADYMRQVQAADAKKYQRLFGKYIEAKIGPDDVENMYKKAHEKIRENPGLPRSDLERGYHRPPRAAPKAAAKGEEKGPSFNPKKLTGKDKKLNAMRKLVGGVVTAE